MKTRHLPVMTSTIPNHSLTTLDSKKKPGQLLPSLHEKVLARTPAQRWGAPDDFAGIAVFLAAPASNFITGVAIPVDGGYSIQG
jgi:2-deoxy-D-gluconate 3-dehydrogenase